jgi:hypothetical protein
MVEVTWDYLNDCLLPTEYVLGHGNRIFVGTSLSDISLAEIIDCTISMNEDHVASILSQVSWHLDKQFAWQLIPI